MQFDHNQILRSYLKSQIFIKIWNDSLFISLALLNFWNEKIDLTTQTQFEAIR